MLNTTQKDNPLTTHFYMITVEASIDIACTPREAFACISKVADYPRWQAGIKSCFLPNRDSVMLGTQYEQHTVFLGENIQSIFEVSRFIPEHKFEVTSMAGGAITYKISKSIFPGLGFTRLIYSTHMLPNQPLEIAEDFLKWITYQTKVEDLQRLKKIIEQPKERLLPVNKAAKKSPLYLMAAS